MDFFEIKFLSLFPGHAIGRQVIIDENAIKPLSLLVIYLFNYNIFHQCAVGQNSLLLDKTNNSSHIEDLSFIFALCTNLKIAVPMVTLILIFLLLWIPLMLSNQIFSLVT